MNIELVKDIMGKDGHKDQIEHLLNTSQPTHLTTTEWCDRMAVIDAGLVFLTKEVKAMTKKGVIIITENLELDLTRNFILKKQD